MIERYQAVHIVMFPWLADVYITPHERMLLANAISIRKFVLSMVVERRKEGNAGVGGDLLSILLSDPLFATNDDIIVDELLTVFFAGASTNAKATQNLLMHLQEHPQYVQ
jgi:cytochrome P450